MIILWIFIQCCMHYAVLPPPPPNNLFACSYRTWERAAGVAKGGGGVRELGGGVNQGSGLWERVGVRGMGKRCGPVVRFTVHRYGISRNILASNSWKLFHPKQYKN